MNDLAVILALFLIFGVVGQMDYEDAKRQEAYACEMVKTGAWPQSYLKEKDITCGESYGKRTNH